MTVIGMLRMTRRGSLFLWASLLCFSLVDASLAQRTAWSQEQLESSATVLEKIKDEGMNRSQVMRTISMLTDVYGPRLTGSPQSRVAAEWTANQLTEWGLANANLETWGPFGRGWSLERSTIAMVEPNYAPLIGHTKAWSPSLPRTVRGTPIYFNASTPEEMEQFRGKLGRAIVLISPPRELSAHFEPEATRKTDKELLELANIDPNALRSGRSRTSRRAPDSASVGSGSPAAAPATAATPSIASPVPSDNNSPPAAPRNETRSSSQLQADKWQMAYEEGAAVILEPGRGDGGNVFVASVTMPRAPDSASANNPFSRGPRPWSPEAATPLPQMVLAAEHYNRLVRMIELGNSPVLEIDIVTHLHDETLDSFNIIAEIPGTDLKDEVVMLGAHFDSWQAGTGATDNAVGCGVAMEAVRILKSIGIEPRRTIRIALWTGEEQGLLGSRAYVEKHFGRLIPQARREGEEQSSGDNAATRQRPRNQYELFPEHEKLSCYFNLDNGAGKIRGIYLQGNEAVRPLFRTWLAPFADLDASTVTAGNTGGTDHLSFDSIGLPGFQFIQDPLEYDTRTHHSSMDVFDRVLAEDMKQASTIMASFIYQAAMNAEKLPRKPLNGDIVSGPATDTEVPQAPLEPVVAPETPAPAAAEAATAPSTEPVNPASSQP